MFTLNPGQQAVVNAAVDWYYYSREQVFQYDGPPGSGKSVVLNEIVKELELDPLTEVAAMSYIGCASIVMRMKGLLSAKTAHSWIYNIRTIPLLDKNGNVVKDELTNAPVTTHTFKPVRHLPKEIKLIIVDEAYSMPKYMRPLIEKFNIKIIACGDQNQLPPVESEPAFLADGKIMHLTECMRQINCPDINYLVERLNRGLPLLNGYYGNSIVIDSSELSNRLLLWADVIICGTNKTRDFMNTRIRQLLGYTSELPQYGEKVVSRKNKWDIKTIDKHGNEISIVNGLIGTVCNNPDVSSYSNGLFSMDFCPDLFPNVVFKDVRCNYNYAISDYSIRNSIAGSKFTPGCLFEFGYAITTYVAQGSQFHNVLYLEEGYRSKDFQQRSNLVGASRADTALVYVKNFIL